MDRGERGRSEQSRNREDQARTVWIEMGRFAGLGLTWTLAVLLFLGGGWWLDGKLGTAPLFTILGAFVGGAAGFYWMYLTVTSAGRETGAQDPPQERDGPER